MLYLAPRHVTLLTPTALSNPLTDFPPLQFYLDNLEEELNVLALRMLVKDLLVLFQAVNEGIINLLGPSPTNLQVMPLTEPTPTEHYFEMSHVDASEALASYRRFCRQTEGVVEYLSIARKLQNLLNVSIPNLKHVRESQSLRRRHFC